MAFIFVNDFVPDVRRTVGDVVLGARVKISFASFYGWVDTLVTTSEKIPSKIVNLLLMFKIVVVVVFVSIVICCCCVLVVVNVVVALLLLCYCCQWW